jgi:predicted RNase H-like nuclease
LFEVHPEVSFAAWLGSPLRYAKRHPGGRAQRLDLIAAHFGESAFATVESQVAGQKVERDDIADAFAALWSAQRLLAGTASRLPDEDRFDELGVPMHIWY